MPRPSNERIDEAVTALLEGLSEQHRDHLAREFELHLESDPRPGGADRRER